MFFFFFFSFATSSAVEEGEDPRSALLRRNSISAKDQIHVVACETSEDSHKGHLEDLIAKGLVWVTDISCCWSRGGGQRRWILFFVCRVIGSSVAWLLRKSDWGFRALNHSLNVEILISTAFTVAWFGKTSQTSPHHHSQKVVSVRRAPTQSAWDTVQCTTMKQPTPRMLKVVWLVWGWCAKIVRSSQCIWIRSNLPKH